MGVIQCAADLAYHFDDPLRFHGRFHLMSQRAGIVINRQDIGVMQIANGLSLTHKPFGKISLFGKVGRQDF